jgi:hypothetical protein
MFLQQKPIPGYWYSNFSGQLIQVRAIVFSQGRHNRIIIEDINGKRESIDFSLWCGMDLVLHSPVVASDADDAVRDL